MCISVQLVKQARKATRVRSCLLIVCTSKTDSQYQSVGRLMMTRLTGSTI